MKYLKYAALGIGGTLVALLFWGVAIEPRLIDVKEETAAIPDLPAAWEGKRVALIADLQVGMWLDNTDTIRRVVERLVGERPAAVLIAGDFVYNPTEDEHGEVERDDLSGFREEINEVVQILRPLTQAGLQTYAVLGNHDYGMMKPNYAKNELLARHVRQSLEAAGVRVLDNEAAALTLPGARTHSAGEDAGATLYVVGVGSHFAHNDNPSLALAQVPEGAARLVMMHNPDSFAAFSAGTAPLAMAGHTHGGQIRLPFTPDWSWMNLVSEDEINADGWIDGYGQPGNRLYVNRGIGFSIVPVRVNCRPELTLFTLRRVD